MAKQPDNPILGEHVEKFELYIRKWQVLLNLLDWRIVRGSKPAGRNNLAEVDCDHSNRLATYRVGRDFGDQKVTDELLEATALHELLHVRNAEMLRLAYKESHYSSEVEGAEHAQIAVFEGLLMKLAHYANAEGRL